MTYYLTWYITNLCSSWWFIQALFLQKISSPLPCYSINPQSRCYHHPGMAKGELYLRPQLPKFPVLQGYSWLPSHLRSDAQTHFWSQQEGVYPAFSSQHWSYHEHISTIALLDIPGALINVSHLEITIGYGKLVHGTEGHQPVSIGVHLSKAARTQHQRRRSTARTNVSFEIAQYVEFVTLGNSLLFLIQEFIEAVLPLLWGVQGRSIAANKSGKSVMGKWDLRLHKP